MTASKIANIAPTTELCYCDQNNIGVPGVSCGDCPTRDYVTVPKSVSERLYAFRAARESQGLKRRELYAHADDWPKIKALASRLTKLREKP